MSSIVFPAIILILLGSLFALLVKIRRERNSPSKIVPLSREKMEKGFTPGSRSAWSLPAGFAALGVVFAVQQLLDPSLPPYTGKWAFVNAAMYGLFGRFGMAALFSAIALACAILAITKFKSERQ